MIISSNYMLCVRALGVSVWQTSAKFNPQFVSWKNHHIVVSLMQPFVRIRHTLGLSVNAWMAHRFSLKKSHKDKTTHVDRFLHCTNTRPPLIISNAENNFVKKKFKFKHAQTFNFLIKPGHTAKWTEDVQHEVQKKWPGTKGHVLNLDPWKYCDFCTVGKTSVFFKQRKTLVEVRTCAQ